MREYHEWVGGLIALGFLLALVYIFYTLTYMHVEPPPREPYKPAKLRVLEVPEPQVFRDHDDL